jgi:hypothetical protein
MSAPAQNAFPPRPVPSRSILMRILIRSWEYRHPNAWAGVRAACGIWNLLLGVILLAYGYGPGLVPLAGSALIFWTVWALRASVQS